MRKTYQGGSIERRDRKNGPDVWLFRYRDANGKKQSEPLGNLQKYPTLAKAQKASMALRMEINERKPGVFFADLVTRPAGRPA